ncbi:isoprenylcysteine carboxylmethyltransferase family protein [Roseibium denhamense]|uniref:Protein-S-isoprenylcysteine O-methyltransferase Ste14 n=1 Tax=Roseibium denhamense TaxID=76305 RepID=A0ABY1PLW4_9HYPH|nr:isoprenylcysteine carboxylmethyltransferase family protein [Roseibium denhamense]MTI05770.1 isoprenylcysteine carboxylmethyltransferase family protein [Roseibium denhamense]SMP37002.1 Protein-S-isoprenylcysteine O-methyltransferase Ste14 [Roseibium denhamense]
MHLKLPPPIIALCAAGLLYGGTVLLPALTLTFPGQWAVAAVFAAAGLVLDGYSVLGFVRQKTTINPLSPETASHLVTSGFYRYTRNPMYLGMALLLTALALYWGTLTALAVLPAFVWYLTEFQIKPEETSLRSLFGADYDAYCARVRRWI